MTSQTISVAEAAEILGIAPRTAYDISKRQEVKPDLRELVPGVPVFKIGGRWRVSRRHLEAFLENPVEQVTL